jgi:hypothetical protein
VLVEPGQVAPGLAEAVWGRTQEDQAAHRWQLIQAVWQARALPVHSRSEMRFQSMAWGLVELATVAAVHP